MHGVALLLIGLLGGGQSVEYLRGLDARRLEQSALDAEGYGLKSALAREADGLKITLKPGEEETGWKTPQQVRFGGDFTIKVNLRIKRVPKPALEDGAAIGLAIAFNDINQPDLTFLRLREPGGAEVYRSIDKGNTQQQPGEGPMMPGMMVIRGGMPAGPGKPPKPPRITFPASGDEVTIELQRENNIIRFQVQDARLNRPRYLGQVTLPPNDIAALKLFATNRNGTEPLEILWRDVTIRADRFHGLGTTVRTVFDQVVYAEPTSIESGRLILGGTPKPATDKTKAQAGANAANPMENLGSVLAFADPAPTNAKPAKSPQEQAKPATETHPEPASNPEPVAAAAPSPLTVTVTVSPQPMPPVPPASPDPSSMPKPGSNPEPGAKPAEPKARLPLEELESIHFERTPTLSARFVGQVNVDLTKPGLSARKNEPKSKDSSEARKQDETRKPKEVSKPDQAKKKDEPKKAGPSDDALAPPPGTTVTKISRVEPEKNGIRDVCLALSGLHPATIKQITVNCQTDKGATSWRIDTSNSEDWPLVLRRSGIEGWAEIYLEPPAGDSFQKNYQVNVVYENGQNDNTSVQAAEHTDPTLAIDAKAPSEPRLGATVYLTGDEKLYGGLESIGSDSIRLATSWQDSARNSPGAGHRGPAQRG